MVGSDKESLLGAGLGIDDDGVWEVDEKGEEEKGAMGKLRWRESGKSVGMTPVLETSFSVDGGGSGRTESEDSNAEDLISRGALSGEEGGVMEMVPVDRSVVLARVGVLVGCVILLLLSFLAREGVF